MFSRYAYIASVVLMCYASFFFYPRWNKWNTEVTISWDVSGYYWYLPSLFIYHDLKGQSFKDSVMNRYHPTNNDFQQGMKLDNGNYVMKYAAGMAVMYLPFFVVAHILAGPLGYPADGFSAPYQLAIQLGGFLVSILGLWYLRKLLLKFYGDRVVGITLLLLVFGSNYLNYAAVDNGMSHCWLFTVYVFLLLNTSYFYETFRIQYAARIGLLVGLLTLTRPTDGLSVIIPLLWGMNSLSIQAIKKQLGIFLKNYKALLIAGVCAAGVVSIQLVYWKYATGHWLFYSYADPHVSKEAGQHLYFRSPNFFNYTFSYQSGWLLYAPVMAFCFIGLIPFLWKGRNKVAIVAFFLLNYYVVCSWNIWWYGGRAMVQSYPILMFPMAALVQAVLTRKALLWVFIPFAAVFIYFNVWTTWQYHRGGLWDSMSMNERYFRRVAGRWSAPERTLELRDNTELFEGRPSEPQLIYQNNFEHDSGAFYSVNALSGAHCLSINKELQASPMFTFPFSGGGAAWLRVQAVFQSADPESDIWKMPQLVVRLIEKNKPSDKNIVKENMIRINRFLQPGVPREIALDMQLPPAHYDSVIVWLLNPGSEKSITMDSIIVWSFR